jgi:hypothetical protein
MADLPQRDALAAAEFRAPALFMTVVKVMNWATIVPWYIDTLGLVPVLIDADHEFACLAAGNGRIGLKGVSEARPAHLWVKVRLVFQVPDVDLARQRLVEKGIEVSAPMDSHDEGYREVRLHDPDGNSLTLFTWIDPRKESRFGRIRQ